MPDQKQKRGRLKKVKRVLAAAGVSAVGVFGVPGLVDVIRAVATDAAITDVVDLPPLPQTNDPDSIKAWLMAAVFMVALAYFRAQMRPKDIDDAEQLVHLGITPEELAHIRAVVKAQKEAVDEDAEP